MPAASKTKSKSARALGQTNFDFLTFVDPGNRGTNAMSVKGDGTCLAATYSLSARVEINPQYLNSPEMKGLFNRVDLYRWNNRLFAFGDDVTSFRHATIERNIGGWRYGEDCHQFFVAASLLNMGIEGAVDLTIGLPPGIYNQQKDNVVKAFMGKTAVISVTTRDGKEYQSCLVYENVRVMPEGTGAVFCSRYHADGSPNDALLKYLAGEVAVIDFGGRTINALLMVNGKFDPTSVVTYEDFGMEHEIIQPIIAALAARNPDLKGILPEEIDYAIRSGTFSFIAPNSSKVEFKPLFDKLMAAYADRVATEIIQVQFNNLAGKNGAFLIGGGAYSLRPYLTQKYAGKIFSRESVDNVAESEVNVEGWRRFVQHGYFFKETK